MENFDEHNDVIIPLIPIFGNLCKKNIKKQNMVLLPSHIKTKKSEVEKLYENQFTNREKEECNEENSKLFNENNKNHLVYHSKAPSSTQLEEKIKCGSLTYLAIKENEYTSKIRDILHQKEVLLNSRNFIIGKDISTTNILHKSQSNFRRRNVIKNQLEITTLNSENRKTIYSVNRDNRILSSQRSETPSPFISSEKKRKRNFSKMKMIIDTRRINSESNEGDYFNNSYYHRQFHPVTPRRKYELLQYQQNKQKRKLYRVKINEKIEQLDLNRIKTEQKLFKLVDNTKIPKKDIDLEVKKDIELLFHIKLKKPKKNNNTKSEFLEAFNPKTRGLRGLTAVNAGLINLADKLTKITDEEALAYVERITEEYMKKSKEAGLFGFINLEDGTQIEINDLKRTNLLKVIKNSLQENSFKIRRLRMKIGQETVQFSKKYKYLRREVKKS